MSLSNNYDYTKEVVLATKYELFDKAKNWELKIKDKITIESIDMVNRLLDGRCFPFEGYSIQGDKLIAGKPILTIDKNAIYKFIVKCEDGKVSCEITQN